MKLENEKIIKIGSQCQETFIPLSLSHFKYLREKGIRFIGTSILKGEYLIRRSTNNSHLVHYTLGGQGWLKTEKHDTKLTEGMVWISPNGTPQEYGLDTDYWHILWFDLKDQAPWHIIEKLGTCIRSSSFGRQFQRILELMLWENQIKGLHCEKIMRLFAETLLLYLEKELELSEGMANSSLINKLYKVFNKVRSRVGEQWTVEKLAEISDLYISPSHFGRLCVQHMGAPPMQIVNQIKMESARELLHSSDIPIKNISEMIGYETYFSFSTAFKKWFGKSPREFRKKMSI